MGDKRELWVDESTHTLHFRGHTFTCDRDVEAALTWHEYALLLSSDTDCLSLWDSEGLVRLTKVGVYPQDMGIHKDQVLVCGGADGKVHLLTLPGLHETEEYSLPGMSERICVHGESAYILVLLTEPEVHTALIKLLPLSGEREELQQLPGIPEAIAADDGGLWVAVSEGAFRLPWPDAET